MEVTLRVFRFNPETDERPRWQEYRVTVEDYATVLDALIEVRESVDETLALRCSCRSHICGSCAMRINRRSGLACKTKVREVADADGVVTVEPMATMRVIKDLVVDLEPFFDKVRAVEPYLQPAGPPPEREYIASHEDMENVKGAQACILCGACVSACTVMEVDGSFLGPTALAKAWRFVADPRDAADEKRLTALSGPGGIWDCTHCFMCVEVCPKGVAPMERILDLRRRAMEAGLTDNNGSRHSQAFVDSISESGWLDETKVAIRSTSGPLELLGWAPVGIRSFVRGKVPLRHYKRPGAEHVKRIFRRLGELDGKGRRGRPGAGAGARAATPSNAPGKAGDAQ
ncbi:MAG: succinate dehydrogenase iron-sulfur subunit [Clostridia bacterium]|nr:succinate dehydrogenase iron-sulfur subunit [Clostridia bacterium]